MFKGFCDHVQKLATLRRTVGLLILLLTTMALVNLADLPFTGPWLNRITGGAAFLDVRPFYTAKEAWNAIAFYGPAGRRACLGFYATWDIAIPLLAFAFSVMALAQLWGSEDLKRLLFIAPMAALTFDLLENIFLSLVMVRFPITSMLVTSVAGVLTLLKWLAYATSAGLLLTGAGRRFRNHYWNAD